MTLLSTLFPGRKLISRVVYDYQAAAYVITAPAKSAVIRCSMVAGGASLAGSAFSRVKAVCTPGETFNLQLGRGSTTAGGNGVDSTLTRNSGPTVICKADAAEPNVAGAAGSCIGDTKRSGTVSGVAYQGGSSGGDDADPYPLGYGGLGAFADVPPGNDFRYPYPGAGGIFNRNMVIVGVGPTVWEKTTILPGCGRATVEFFTVDPGVLYV